MAKDAGGHGSERRLDHGELNIPLAKRMKGFHAELDRYKRDKAQADARAHKDILRTARTSTAEALDILKTLPAERLSELGKPHGLTPAGTRKMLESAIRTRPEVGLKTMQREAERLKVRST